MKKKTFQSMAGTKSFLTMIDYEHCQQNFAHKKKKIQNVFALQFQYESVSSE
jgi:hypothetical protein